MKRVTVILVALAAGVIYADSTDPDLALGYQFLPDSLPVGFTGAFDLRRAVGRPTRPGRDLRCLDQTLVGSGPDSR